VGWRGGVRGSHARTHHTHHTPGSKRQKWQFRAATEPVCGSTSAAESAHALPIICIIWRCISPCVMSPSWCRGMETRQTPPPACPPPRGLGINTHIGGVQTANGTSIPQFSLIWLHAFCIHTLCYTPHFGHCPAPVLPATAACSLVSRSGAMHVAVVGVRTTPTTTTGTQATTDVKIYHTRQMQLAHELHSMQCQNAGSRLRRRSPYVSPVQHTMQHSLLELHHYQTKKYGDLNFWELGNSRSLGHAGFSRSALPAFTGWPEAPPHSPLIDKQIRLPAFMWLSFFFF
jgi:hypothetical protein